MSISEFFEKLQESEAQAGLVDKLNSFTEAAEAILETKENPTEEEKDKVFDDVLADNIMPDTLLRTMVSILYHLWEFSDDVVAWYAKREGADTSFTDLTIDDLAKDLLGIEPSALDSPEE